jgi:cell division protein ZapA
MTEPRVVHVDIQGQRYAIKSELDPKYVNDIAAFVDQKMERVGRELSTADSVRLAVLAALNIADEVFRLREEKSRAGDGLATRAAALAKELGAALGE